MSTLLTIEDVAGKLNVSSRTIKRYLADRKIAGIKLPGGEWRFRPEWLENWIDSRTVKARKSAAGYTS